MQRVALALILVALVVAGAAMAWSRLRAALALPGHGAVADLPAERRDGAVQKTAFGLLVGVILYVGFSGAS